MKLHHGILPYAIIILLPITSFIAGVGFGERRASSIASPPTILYDNSSCQKKTSSTEDEKKPVQIENIRGIDISYFSEAYALIEQKFVDPEAIDPNKIKYDITRGLVWSLGDPYSVFMNPKENQDFEDDINGELHGIGAELTIRNGVITVVSPLRDSPAERAGLLPEDIITKVDGEEASAEDFFGVIRRIRGKQGSKVVVTIFRPQSGEEKELSITRDTIRVETVVTEWKDNIVVLEVSQFGTNTQKEFQTALSEALKKNPTGIILDLRFNGGGLLDTAVNMISAFVKGKETAVIQQGRRPNTINLRTNGRFQTDVPLVVLQNGGSASASEIVAGALQDLGRGVVIGTQSFGKGTVQELIQMQNGAFLRLTVAKWLTPNGRSIHEKGITPDLLVARTKEDFSAERDPQMDAALAFLRGASLEELRKKEKEKQAKGE